MIRDALTPWHVIVVVLVILLVFGGKKLPELARGSGRALRIFKAETKGLMDDDDEPTDPPSSSTAQQRVAELGQPEKTATDVGSRERRPDSVE